MLIAQTRTSRPLSKFQHIVGIGRCHLGGMFKPAVVGRVGSCVIEVLQSVTAVVAIDIFAAYFKFVPFGYLPHVVCLKSMLSKPFVAIVQHTCIVERSII